MSVIDFSQDARDHGRLHVAVFPLGDTSGPLYAAVTEALQTMSPIILAEPKGTVIFLRFLSPLPKWSRDGTHWEDFTAYKQILGVLTIAQCHDADDLLNIHSGFKAKCEQFKRTLCDSRCVVYGPKEQLQNSADSRKGFSLIDLGAEHDTFTSEDLSVEALEEIVSDFALSIYVTLKSRIGEFVKSYGGGGGRTDQVKLLKTPFEFKDPDHDEVPGEPRHFGRNHMQARVTKHLGDLYLLTGQLQQAHSHYWESLEALKSNKDWLWAGSSYEGLGTTAMVMRKCEEVLGHKLQGTTISQSPIGKVFKSASSYRLAGKSGGGGSLRGSATGLTHHSSIRRAERNSGGGMDPKTEVRIARYATVRRKSPSPDLELGVVEEGSLRGKALEQRQDSLSNLIDVNSDEEASLRNSSSSPSASLSLSLEPDGTGSEGVGSEGAGTEGTEPEETEEEDSEMDLFVDKRLLQKDFIVDKYTLAIHFYSKAGAIGGVSQMEALIKFAKYLVSQRRYTLACETLQRMITVESFVTQADKVSLYGTMAAVFRSMNFQRKAALFTHYAALQSTTLARTTQDFYHAHKLLLQCLPGYKLSLDADKQAKETAAYNGWPYLQACILKDLVFLARGLNENLAAVRHTCFLLQTLYKHLSEEDLQEVTKMLEDIVLEAKEAHEMDKAAVPFLKGFLDSPIPLTEFPQVRSFAPQYMAPSLTPHRHAKFALTNSSDGPFIYSALSARKKKQEEIPWVLGDPADIAMIIHNPLPFELRVQKMAILTKGAKVDAYPSSLSLPASSEPQNFILLVIPQEAGQVNILGYEATVFGVHSKCLVKIPGDPVIQVVPPLPQLRVNTFPAFGRSRGGGGSDDVTGKSPEKLCLDRADDRRSSMGAKDKFELMDGETCEVTFRLDCCRDVPVEQITLSVKEYNMEYCEFSWSEESINSILPLAKDEIGNFYVQIRGKVPSWLRLNNDITVGITQPSLLAYGPGIIAIPTMALEQESGSLPTSPRKVAFDENSPSSIPRASTPPNLSSFSPSSPSSSPVPKRAKKARTNLLAFHNAKQRTSQPDPEALKNSPILTSLSLECPTLFDSRAHKTSLPAKFPALTNNSQQKRGYATLRESTTTFYVDELESDDYDFDKFNDKRASIRSDPGEEFLTPNSRSHFSLRQKGSDSRPTSMPKSETVAGNMSSLSNGGLNLTPPSVFEPASSSMFRVASGGSIKSPYRKSVAGGNITKGAISLPTGPLYKAVPHPPARKKVVGQFVLQYTGGGGATEGYYRETSASVTVNIKPSLIFEQFDLRPVDGSKELFQMNFHVQNISKHKLEVTCTITQEGLRDRGVKTTQVLQLEAEEKRSLSVTLCRFLVPEARTLGINNESNTAKLYCEKITKMVHFCWRAVDSGRMGTVTLDGLRLPLSSISIVRPVPLLFDMRLDGHLCPMQGSHIEDFQLGASITTQVKITNNSGGAMPPSLLSLEPYQFSQEQKKIITDLRGKMLYTGSLVTSVPELQAGGSYHHTVSLMFLYKGTYQLEVKSATILSPDRTSLSLRPASPSTETQQGQQRQAVSTTQEIDRRSRGHSGGTDMAKLEKQKLAKTKSEGLKKSNRDRQRTTAAELLGRENGRSHSLGAISPEATKHTLATTRDSADKQAVPSVAVGNRHRTVPVTPLIEEKDGSSSPRRLCLPTRTALVSDGSAARAAAVTFTFSHSLPQLGHFKLSRPVCGPHITFHVV